MRIALVTPLVTRVFGNRCAFVLARALAREHDVTVYVHTLYDSVAEEAARQVAPARVEALHRSVPRRESMARLLYWQLVRSRDRALAERLRSDHRARPFDAIVVFADEGHWIGEYVRSWPATDRPVTAVCVLELLDHPFLLGYERPFPAIRRLATLAYPLVHAVEARRLAAFDLRFGISSWASTLVGYLYGLPTDGELAAFDDSMFPAGRAPSVEPPYLALPTASLDPRGLALVAWLRDRGIRFVAYGPRGVEGVTYRGFVPDAAMNELLGGARGTLFLFDYEALGLLPIESLAAGTPVVTEPKQGPFAEHRGNPNVHFGTTPEALLAACRDLLARPKEGAVAEACRRSVDGYRPSGVAARLADRIEHARGRSASPGPPG